MTSELSFLLDLLLHQRMPLPIKELVAARIKEVEIALNAPTPVGELDGFTYKSPGYLAKERQVSIQAASTQAILDRNPDLAAKAQQTYVPVEVIAQTPAAVAAINSRQQIMAEAMSGKPGKGETSPKKFRGNL